MEVKYSRYQSLNAFYISYLDRYGLATDYDYTDYFNSLDSRIAQRTDGYNEVSPSLEVGVTVFPLIVNLIQSNYSLNLQ